MIFTCALPLETYTNKIFVDFSIITEQNIFMLQEPLEAFGEIHEREPLRDLSVKIAT